MVHQIIQYVPYYFRGTLFTLSIEVPYSLPRLPITLENAGHMANSVDRDQTPILRRLIWVYTACSVLSVRTIPRFITAATALTFVQVTEATVYDQALGKNAHARAIFL